MILLKFRSGELVGCRIKFHIQRVPTLHTFDEPLYPKNKKYMKNMMMTKVCSVGTRWVHNLIPHPTSSPTRNLSKKAERCKKYEQKK